MKIFIGLGQNFALLLSLTFVYGLLIKRYVKWAIRPVIAGAVFGTIAVLGMLAPIQMAPGVIVDGRTVVVALGGAFGGAVAAATAGALVGAYRLWLGGAGTLTGVGAILTAMLLGAWVQARWGSQVRSFGPRKFLLLGLALAVSGVLWTFALPHAELRWRMFRLFVPSIGLFFPLESLLLGLLLSSIYVERTRLTLAESSIDRCGDAVFWASRSGKVVNVNPAAARLSRFSRDELLSMHVLQTGIVPSQEAWFDVWERARERGVAVLESDLRTKSGATVPVETSASVIEDEGPEFACLCVRDNTERNRAEASLRQYADRLKSLRQIDTSILAAHSPQAIAEAALQHVRELIPCARVSVVLFDWKTAEASILAVRADDRTSMGPGVRIPLEAFGNLDDLRRGREHLVAEALALSDPPPFIRVLQAEGVRSWVSIPLLARGQLMGVLCFGKRDPGAFPAEHLEIAREVADPVAVAIQQARLYEAEQQARRVAETLRAASLALTRTLDLGAVLTTLLDYAGQLVPYDRAGVSLLDADSRLVLRAGRGHERWDSPVLRQSPADDAADHVGARGVLAARESVVVADTDEHPGWRRPAGGRHMRNWLGVPLVVGGGVIGLYFLEKAEPGCFSDEHVRLAEALAAQASAAIQNARLFEQVRESREQLEALSHRLTQVQEAERRFIARELHDEIGQLLAGLKLAVEMSARKTPEAPSLREVEARLGELIARIRELSLDLRPAMLDDLGLLPALLWHFERCASQTGVRVAFKHRGVERRFEPELETAVYRIVQEGLTNVARHAGVSEATVRLWCTGHELGLQIEDGGTGFDAKAVLGGGASSGIAGMRERARLLGGEVTVESVPGIGTRLTAELPVRREDRGEERRE